LSDLQFYKSSEGQYQSSRALKSIGEWRILKAVNKKGTIPGTA
jgi:hypothetical protein